MTVATYFADNGAPTPEPVVNTDGGRMIMRTIQRITGFALALAAAALWITPGSNLDGDVLLYKLVLSLTSIIAGLGLMQASSRPASPEVEIDTIRREVRLVRRNRKAGTEVLSRSAYSDLGKVELEGPYVRLWDANMSLIAEVAIHGQEARRRFLNGLRDEGKIA